MKTRGVEGRRKDDRNFLFGACAVVLMLAPTPSFAWDIHVPHLDELVHVPHPDEIHVPHIDEVFPQESKALADAENQVRTDTLPSIEAGVRHFVGEVDQGMSWGDHHCAEHPDNWQCHHGISGSYIPAQPNQANLPPFVLVELPGAKLWAVIENRASSPQHIQVYDATGKGWIFSKTLQPWEKVRVPLVINEVGKGDAYIRKDYWVGQEPHVDFIAHDDKITV